MTLFSAIQRVNAVVPQSVAEIVAAVLLAYSSWLEQIHMPIFTLVESLFVTLPDNAKLFVNNLIYSQANNHALGSIGYQYPSS